VSGAARTWLADPSEAGDVARLLIGFRDHYGRSEPPDQEFRDGVERLIARDDTESMAAGYRTYCEANGLEWFDLSA